ncbi:YidC/Oxa1 family insertase periplasmic-domain containing protein, partial [Clostridium perfringens]
DTVWQASGSVLKPGQPVTLQAANARGQRFQIKLSVDDGYMFTITQTVLNAGSGPVPVAPYGYVSRVGVSKDPGTWQIHSGPMSVHNGGADYGVN